MASRERSEPPADCGRRPLTRRARRRLAGVGTPADSLRAPALCPLSGNVGPHGRRRGRGSGDVFAGVTRPVRISGRVRPAHLALPHRDPCLPGLEAGAPPDGALAGYGAPSRAECAFAGSRRITPTARFGGAAGPAAPSSSVGAAQGGGGLEPGGDRRRAALE